MVCQFFYEWNHRLTIVVGVVIWVLYSCSLSRVHTNAVVEIRINVDSPNAYSIRIGLVMLQVTTTNIYIVKTNGGHGAQCVARLCSFVSAFCCLFVAGKALISS